MLQNYPPKVQSLFLPIDIASYLSTICAGSPTEPKCGFSRKVVEALQEINQPFGHFDILTDEAIRQGLKEYYQWPTYPQVYVNGELLGGCDIVLEMAAAGELKDSISGMLL